MKITWLAFLWFLCAGGARAQEKPTSKCVLVVAVRNEIGLPLDGAVVQLVNDNGRKVWESRTVNGEVCLRDFPFGNHSVIVAPESCHPVVVLNVRMSLIAPYRLFVTKPGCPHLTGGAVCMLYARAVDADGNPIVQAQLRTEGTAVFVKADEYGRMVMGIPQNQHFGMIVEAPGYVPLGFSPECIDITKPIEKEAVLKKIGVSVP